MAVFARSYLDGQRIEIAGLTVRLSVNARARQISLRIDRRRREAVAVAHSPRSLPKAVAFARHRVEWIAMRLAELPPCVELRAGDEMLVLGRICCLAPDGRRARFEEDANSSAVHLRGCGDGVVDRQLVARAIKSRARSVFAQGIARCCAELGVDSQPRLYLTDARTRWGSCTPARPNATAAIRLSWRLALAPVEVADYVAAHECAHLVEPNHGPGFWRLVRSLVDDEGPARSWLRVHGPRLHALV